MKYLLFLLFSATLLAQNVSVEKIELEGKYFYPKSVNDSLLLLTTENYSGLYLYNISTNKVDRISDEKGAGYGADFVNNEIYFRTYELKQGRKYYSLKQFDLNSKEIKTIISGKRYVSLPIKNKDGIKFTAERNYWKNNDEELFVTNEDSKIWIHKGNTRSSFEPLGSGIYVWPELSPDGEKITFTFGSNGSFVFDLNGELLLSLGKEAHYPKWSPNGKFIVYMTDKDDGHRMLSSDIEMIEISTGKKIRVTKTEDIIEMYPCWNQGGDKVYFNDLEGNIYRAAINFGEGK